MTTKKDAQFSFDECSCMEMMSQSKGQQGEGDACAKIMAPFANLQDSGGECFEMMRQMMASCCDIEHEGDSTTREA